ncbi:porin [Candidatus Latescibacterota bacterium]
MIIRSLISLLLNTLLTVVMFHSTGIVYADDTRPKITGYIKSSFTNIPGNDYDTSEFKVRNARIKFAGNISSSTEYCIFSDAVSDDVLLDAYITQKVTSSLSVKVGQFKTPYSTENLRGGSKLAFINRPYLQKDASPSFRDKGLQVSYKVNMFDLQVALMNGSGQNKAETNNNKSIAYRVVAYVIPQFQLSGNFYTGKNYPDDSLRDEFINIGASGTTGTWEYSSEYAMKKHGTLTGSSFFAYVAYDWDTTLKRFPLLTSGLRAEFSDPNTNIGNNARSRYTIGLTAHFGKKYLNRVMINYERCDDETGEPDDVIGIEYMVKY